MSKAANEEKTEDESHFADNEEESKDGDGEGCLLDTENDTMDTRIYEEEKETVG